MSYIAFSLAIILIFTLAMYFRLVWKYHSVRSQYAILENDFISLTAASAALIEKPKVQDLFPKSPLCQFCKNPLTGHVKRRSDGYWCCADCSVKVFHQVQ